MREKEVMQMSKADRTKETRTQGTGPLGVALIGTKFMGRAHSTAWGKCAQFFELRRPPALRVVAGRNPTETAAFAARWGWQASTTEWRDVLSNPDI